MAVSAIARLSSLLLIACICLPAPYALAATSLPVEKPGDEHRHVATEAAHQRLKEIEQHRKELQVHLHEARKKEQAALQQLNRIKSKLNATTGALNESKHKLKKTESNLRETVYRIGQTKTQEETVEDQAAKRLREIYEGQRLGLIEMVFQVTSIQSLLDMFYYQERVAEMDRRLLDDLRAKTAALAAKKDQLGTQKSSLGELVTEFAKKALQLNKEKDDQEQIAERLRTQRAFYEQAERQLAQESAQLERQIVDMCHNKKANAMQGSGTMSMPLHASITSPFGWRRHPIFGVRKFHTGVDIAGANHSEIHAADSGSVLYSGWYGGYGKVVIVSHGKGMATLYAHMSKTAVNPGQNIQKGDIVGYEGTTGFSTGPHLHFEVRVDGKPNNPLNYVH